MHLRGRWWLILTFITPGLVLYTVFVLSSFAQGVQISFTNWTGYTPTLEYVGLDNYVRMARDGAWWRAVSHNAVLLVIIPVVTLGMITSSTALWETALHHASSLAIRT